MNFKMKWKTTINPQNSPGAHYKQKSRNLLPCQLINFNNLWTYEMSSSSTASKYILVHSQWIQIYICFNSNNSVPHSKSSQLRVLVFFNSFIRVVSDMKKMNPLKPFWNVNFFPFWKFSNLLKTNWSVKAFFLSENSHLYLFLLNKISSINSRKSLTDCLTDYWEMNGIQPLRGFFFGHWIIEFDVSFASFHYTNTKKYEHQFEKLHKLIFIYLWNRLSLFWSGDSQCTLHILFEYYVAGRIKTNSPPHFMSVCCNVVECRCVGGNIVWKITEKGQSITIIRRIYIKLLCTTKRMYPSFWVINRHKIFVFTLH